MGPINQLMRAIMNDDKEIIRFICRMNEHILN